MIYIMHANFNQYSAFKMDEFAACEFLGKDLFFLADPSPHRYSEKWQTIEIEFENFDGIGKVKPIPDLINFSGRLFFNQKAFDVVQAVLKEHGEFLPITYGLQSGYFFNPLCIAESLNALDYKLSVKNDFGDIEHLSIIENKLSNVPIFKTEFDNFSNVYCSDQFKSIIESNNLNGVTFGKDLARPVSYDGSDTSLSH